MTSGRDFDRKRVREPMADTELTHDQLICENCTAPWPDAADHCAACGDTTKARWTPTTTTERPESWTCDKCGKPMRAVDGGRKGFAHVSGDDAFLCGSFRPPKAVRG